MVTLVLVSGAVVPIFNLSASELSIPIEKVVVPEICKLIFGSPVPVQLISTAVAVSLLLSKSKALLGVVVPIPTWALTPPPARGLKSTR